MSEVTIIFSDDDKKNLEKYKHNRQDYIRISNERLFTS